MYHDIFVKDVTKHRIPQHEKILIVVIWN